VLTDVWKNLGFNVLVFLSGLQSIPHDFYEAAEVDGASPWQQFYRITLPLLSPTTLFLIVIQYLCQLCSRLMDLRRMDSA
jgi:multiple sugar transport system permease protein